MRKPTGDDSPRAEFDWSWYIRRDMRAHDADDPLDWRPTWRELKLEPPRGLHADLLARWSEPWRHYHDLRHLEDCLGLFAEVRAASARPAEIELALWFHDAIYEPRARDNEERSIALARLSLGAAGLEAAIIDRVAALIQATCHEALPPDPEARLLVAVDLGVLGAAPERFAAYEQDIRREFFFVPEADYRAGRARVLRGFLDRSVIYDDPTLHARLELQARVNLASALANLTGDAR